MKIMNYESSAFRLDIPIYIYHFTRCKQHWSRSTSCFSFIVVLL